MATADLDEQIERLKKCEFLKEQEVKALCDRARDILCDESNVQRVDSPVTVSVDQAVYCIAFSVWDCCDSVRIPDSLCLI
jgi:hypothetical protein